MLTDTSISTDRQDLRGHPSLKKAWHITRLAQCGKYIFHVQAGVNFVNLEKSGKINNFHTPT